MFYAAKPLLTVLITGRNEPLKKDRPKWKSDYPMTEGQLRSKRDEFWDTAPAFEGRKEIWDALKAAAVALECNDHELAQAIVNGASITLPHGEDERRWLFFFKEWDEIVVIHVLFFLDGVKKKKKIESPCSLQQTDKYLQ